MATMLSSAVVPVATATTVRRKKSNPKVSIVKGLSPFGGLKAHNKVVSLGLPVGTDQQFSKVLACLKFSAPSKGRGGGALSSTCNATEEIFKIAVIMNGLVLVGVAVGFVLLRVEAAVEDAE